MQIVCLTTWKRGPRKYSCGYNVKTTRWSSSDYETTLKATELTFVCTESKELITEEKW